MLRDGATGRVVAVTGGASGIGAAIVEGFLGEGAAVSVLDMDEDAAGALIQRFGQPDDRLRSIPVDVADEASVSDAMSATVAAFGRLDVLVTSAGVNTHMPITQLSGADFRRCVEVDMAGVYYVAKHAEPHLRRSPGDPSSSIINIASVMAWFTAAGYHAYTAAKAGSIGLTRSLAVELGPKGIRVNAIAPGFIDTALWEQVVSEQDDPDAFAERIRSLHPVGRRGLPGDISAAVRFLASRDAGFISGQTLVVDGGLTCRLPT